MKRIVVEIMRLVRNKPAFVYTRKRMVSAGALQRVRGAVRDPGAELQATVVAHQCRQNLADTALVVPGRYRPARILTCLGVRRDIYGQSLPRGWRRGSTSDAATVNFLRACGHLTPLSAPTQCS